MNENPHHEKVLIVNYFNTHILLVTFYLTSPCLIWAIYLVTETETYSRVCHIFLIQYSSCRPEIIKQMSSTVMKTTAFQTRSLEHVGKYVITKENTSSEILNIFVFQYVLTPIKFHTYTWPVPFHWYVTNMSCPYVVLKFIQDWCHVIAISKEHLNEK